LASLDKFEYQYSAVVTELESLTTGLNTSCSAHLPSAPPASLGALETTGSVTNPKKLPIVPELFTLVRDTLSRSAASGNNLLSSLTM